jgi:hypothetical protein
MNIELSSRNFTAALFAISLIAGFCARASAASTPVSACGTLSTAGNYLLTTNLTATGSCLVIAAANVAIDMNGKTITGSGSGVGIGDDGTERDFAIIANGNIRNFAVGIDLNHSGEGIFSNVDSSNNIDEGIFIQLCCNTLDAVTANGNGSNGIEIISGDSSLSNIQANGNGAGIVIGGRCNTLVGSVASNNSLGIDEGGDSFVIGSKFQNNHGPGLEMVNGDNGVINSNTSNNAGAGMFLNGDHNMVTASKANGNFFGIDIELGGSAFAILSGVKANNNTTNGVNMNCPGSTASASAKNNARNNAGGNLVQTAPNGPCANVDLKAR